MHIGPHEKFFCWPRNKGSVYMMWSWQNELPRGKTEHSTDERADTVAFAPDVEDADADDEDDPSRSDADLSDDEDGWGLAEMVTFHPDAHFAFCTIPFSSSMRRLTSAGFERTFLHSSCASLIATARARGLTRQKASTNSLYRVWFPDPTDDSP